MADHDDDAGDAPPPLDALATGFRKRTLGALRVATTVGMRMAKRGLGLDAPENAEDAGRAAELLVARLDELKGLSMKVGQMMAYLDHTVPEPAQRALRKLQSRSRPMAYPRIAALVEAELGAPPERLFDDFSPEPFAAASIGQVHAARLGGRPVAVKVQYPGIDGLMEGDLKALRTLAKLAFLASPIDGEALVAELTDRVREECDYRLEAENLVRFARVFAGRRDIGVPAVHLERCSRRVLTTDLSTRRDFYAFRDGASAEARDRAGALIYEACFQSIFRHCTYNADPHPGNYLFADDGAVTLLDFGCVKRFSPEHIANWRRLAEAVLAGDRDAFRDAWIACGFVGRRRGYDFDHQLEVMRILYRPMLTDGPFTFTHAFVREVNDALAFKNKNKFKMGLGADWLFVNRLQFGLFSVLAHLGATVRYGELFRAALAAPIDPLWRKPIVAPPQRA